LTAKKESTNDRNGLGFSIKQRLTRGIATHQPEIDMTTTIDQIFALIAEKHLFIETLETRNSDRLDFHDVAVWSVRDALEATFKAGVELGASTPKATESEIAQD
jgi:hypothetical protein